MPMGITISEWTYLAAGGHWGNYWAAEVRRRVADLLATRAPSRVEISYKASRISVECVGKWELLRKTNTKLQEFHVLAAGPQE